MTPRRPNITDPGRVIAHRGASQVAPENTLAAFRAAADQGAFWAEFDVSLLGDATPVIHHDATLERCTSGTGPLAHLTALDLAGLDAGAHKGAAFRGEPLPTLDEALDLLEALGFYANLEMKPHDQPMGRLAGVVAKALHARPWTQTRIITSSFDHAELGAFRAAMPHAAIAMLWNKPPDTWREDTDALDAAAIHLNYVHITESLLSAVVSSGIDLRVFTINQPQVMARFRDQGLTGVITDHPPLFLEDPGWADWTRS